MGLTLKQRNGRPGGAFRTMDTMYWIAGFAVLVVLAAVFIAIIRSIR